MATKKRGMTEHKVVMTLPDLGLKPKEISALKSKFKNEIVTSMGGPDALVARRIIIVVIVVIIIGPAGW
jgi:hypothetical protein